MKPNIHILALGGTIASVTKPQSNFYDNPSVAIKDWLAMQEMTYADLFLLAQRIRT
jgi:L-asparaginase/Glu-tRNA(Gln) amidotransferase subunit D